MASRVRRLETTVLRSGPSTPDHETPARCPKQLLPADLFPSPLDPAHGALACRRAKYRLQSLGTRACNRPPWSTCESLCPYSHSHSRNPLTTVVQVYSLQIPCLPRLRGLQRCRSVQCFSSCRRSRTPGRGNARRKSSTAKSLRHRNLLCGGTRVRHRGTPAGSRVAETSSAAYQRKVRHSESAGSLLRVDSAESTRSRLGQVVRN